jgi:hypothetical protein
MERIFFAEEELIFCALKGSKITHINPLHQINHPGELMLCNDKGKKTTRSCARWK